MLLTQFYPNTTHIIIFLLSSLFFLVVPCHGEPLAYLGNGMVDTWELSLIHRDRVSTIN